jgi:Insect pheromone-binding family, A10/OS-D
MHSGRNYVERLAKGSIETLKALSVFLIADNLSDAIETDCCKCSEKQRIGATKVMRYLIDNRPDDWARIETIYDTEGTYRMAYLKEKEDAVTNATTIISTDNNSTKN